MEGQYLGPTPFIFPEYIALFLDFLKLFHEPHYLYKSYYKKFDCYIFLVKNEKKYGSASAFCFSNLSKFIVLASSLGGVPVFNLPILKLYFFSCSLKPTDGFSSYLPAGVFHLQCELNHLKMYLLLKLVYLFYIHYRFA